MTCDAVNKSPRCGSYGQLFAMLRPPALRLAVIAFTLIASLLPTSASADLLWGSPKLVNGLSHRATPKPVASQVAKVSLSGTHTLYLKEDGTLWGAGRNHYGQSGSPYYPLPRSFGFQIGTNVVEMAAVDNLSVFLKADGSLWILGSRPGNSLPILTPLQMGADVTAFAVIPGRLYYINSSAALRVWSSEDSMSSKLVSNGVSSVAASSMHTLFVKNDGTLWAIGSNLAGQLGDGTTTHRVDPVQVATGVSKAYAGNSISFFIKNDGSLWGMGQNEYGQLGDGTTTNKLSPVQVATDVTEVSANGSSVYFLKTDGSLWAMGQNDLGQLGAGNTVHQTLPVQVANNVTEVYAGWLYALFLKSDETLWAMGSNYYGQLGDGSKTNRSTPVQIAAEIKTGATNSHSAFVTSAGELWTMGKNHYGQLADGSQHPDFALLAEDVVAMDMGLENGLYVKNDGTLWSVADGHIASAGSDIADVDVGDFDFSRAYLKNDGTLWYLDLEGSSTQIAEDVVLFGVSTNYIAYTKSDGSLWGKTRPGGATSSNIHFDSGDAVLLEETGVSSLSAALSQLLYVKEPDTLRLVEGSPSVPQSLHTGVKAAYSNFVSKLYIDTNDVLWDSGWQWNFAQAAQIATDVAKAGVSLEEDYYLKLDGSLWRSGSWQNLATHVTDVSVGFESGIMFLQSSGQGTAPSITVQPQPVAATYGDWVFRQTEATGSGPLDYQWFKDDVALPSQRSRSLSIGYATFEDAGEYRVRVKNSAGEVFSDTVTLDVVQAPPPLRIVNHPQSISAADGTSAQFTVAVVGLGPYDFYWQSAEAGSDIWVTRSTHHIASSIGILLPEGTFPGTVLHIGEIAGPSSQGRRYRAMVVTPYGTMTSDEAVLTVTGIGATFPVIFAQPTPASVELGRTVSLTAAATGSQPMNYQWQFQPAAGGAWANINDGPSYVGAISPTLFIVASRGVYGSYRAVISNPAGSVTSVEVMLTVLMPKLAPEAADFDGDGKDDILWSHSGSGERAMWQMDGAEVAAGAVIGTVPVAWEMSVTGDFDGDGKSDIFWTNTSTGDRAAWLMNGSSVALNAYLSVVPVEWVVSGSGDFNGDGKDDILWTNTATGDRAMWFMNGGAYAGGGYLTMVPLAWQVRSTGDFNGNGKADILWSNVNTGERALWLMDGTVLASGAVIGTVPVEWIISASGDYNRDGKADIFWTNTSTGDRAAWLMNGSAILGNAYLSRVPANWQVSGAGDYNGDGKSDVLWTNTATGDRTMWFMNGGTVLGGGYLTNVPLEWMIR